jgi:hypothetical protein
MVREDDQDEEHAQAAVGTVKKSMETRSQTWLVRNARHVCDGGERRFGSKRETVRSATSMPSLTSSPWTLGASHRGLAAAILLTRVLIAASTGGRPAGERPESLAQCRRKRCRCQRSTVAGATMTRPVSRRAKPWTARPKGADRSVELRPLRRPLVDGQLLPQGKVLEGELAAAAAGEREESEQIEQEGDHRARIFTRSESPDQSLVHRTEFWRRTTVTRGCCGSRRIRFSDVRVCEGDTLRYWNVAARFVTGVMESGGAGSSGGCTFSRYAAVAACHPEITS